MDNFVGGGAFNRERERGKVVDNVFGGYVDGWANSWSVNLVLVINNEFDSSLGHFPFFL